MGLLAEVVWVVTPSEAMGVVFVAVIAIGLLIGFLDELYRKIKQRWDK